jgi:hypothetical protein
MADPPDASEMSMDASGSTSVKELDPTGLNENSTGDSIQSSSTAEMNNISTLPLEIVTKIFEYLSISDRLHFRFVPTIQGVSFLYFLGNFIHNQTEVERF